MLSRLRLFLADKGRRRIIYFFIIVLLFSRYTQKKKMQEQIQVQAEFFEQKNMLRDELDDIIDEHDDLLEEYGDLNSQLEDKDSLIQQQIIEIRDLIRTKSDLEEARKKIEVLKEISKRYIANIDSLLILNEELTRKKDSVININKSINWRNYKLNKENEALTETVNRGSVLKLDNVEVQAIKYKVTGKEARTRRAKKTQKIQICFSVLANPIAKTETKTVYMQLIDANDLVITANKDIRLSIGEQEIICTDSTVFDYKNLEIMHCFEWERIDVLNSGVYFINLFIEDRMSSQTILNLK